jgi:hypothetical protein
MATIPAGISPIDHYPKSAKEAAKKSYRIGFRVHFEKKKVDGKHVVHGSIREDDVGGMGEIPQEYTDMGKLKSEVGKKCDEYAGAYGESTDEAKKE